ncbi:hypothetical protein BKA69DRAFT_160388 [Paraphysoderma sedebokerense]|nr:hypothetical protein BKA69DRAFT_160388 [Paraphysoderma sedebokerense]
MSVGLLPSLSLPSPSFNLPTKRHADSALVQKLFQLQSPVHDVILESSTSIKSEAKTYVVAVDGSKHSRSALEEAVTKFVGKDDHVILLNVREAVYVDEFALINGADFINYLEKQDEKARVKSYNLLLSYSVELKQRGFNVKAVALRGDVQAEILRASSTLRADSVIIGLDEATISPSLLKSTAHRTSYFS